MIASGRHYFSSPSKPASGYAVYCYEHSINFTATLDPRLDELNRSTSFDWGDGVTEGCLQLAYALVRDATGSVDVAHGAYFALAKRLGDCQCFSILGEHLRDWAVARRLEQIYAAGLRADWSAYPNVRNIYESVMESQSEGGLR